MNRLRISKGGQISVPAAIRHRWGTQTLTISDEGDHAVLRPAPDDPITAARGALAGRTGAVDALRRRAREDEERATRRR